MNNNITNKQSSYPPMIILLDVLFIFLFILILNSDRSFKIKLPTENLFPNAKIVYKNNNGYFFYINSPEKIYIPKKRYSKILDCNKHPKCLIYDKKNIGVILPDIIFEEISNLTTAVVTETSCKRLTHYILMNGKLDYQRMLNEFPCLEELPNIRSLIDK